MFGMCNNSDTVTVENFILCILFIVCILFIAHYILYTIILKLIINNVLLSLFITNSIIIIYYCFCY